MNLTISVSNSNNCDYIGQEQCESIVLFLNFNITKSYLHITVILIQQFSNSTIILLIQIFDKLI